MSDKPRCELCGEPMPDGEEMFKYHGYSGLCPKPPLPRSGTPRTDAANDFTAPEKLLRLCRQLERELADARAALADRGEEYTIRLAEIEENLESAKALIRSFDAAIRKIATELTGQACGGVDTGDNINPETGEPYGPGGHTGWLLASEARKLREERDRYKADVAALREQLAAREARATELQTQLSDLVSYETAEKSNAIRREHEARLLEELAQYGEESQMLDCDWIRSWAAARRTK